MTMQSASALPPRISPSPATLAKATGGAALAAIAIVTLFVLPAEYGIDPTGVGSAIGLNGMVAGEAADSAPVPDAAAPTDVAIPTKATIAKPAAWRQDEMTITLAPHSGQEVKAHMTKGDSFIFTWASTGGPVKAEMHGEKAGATDGAFTDYWKELDMTGGQGDFTAPFDGTHGWYFRNKGETPVTVTVKTVGFYKDLFLPKGE
ncbi:MULTISPECIES: hypothetical protein [Sphingomonadaceae]|uniref:Transmembrane anchor protein n=1 Tax=Sphingomonas bisphenolicum TaxID=296544 RepID=A0ABM7GAJ0_9SPHN|nr:MULTISPECIES: hypothetical protein [Sphingomonadaceae]MBZ9649817.1 hypothetical protein [Sphingobium sp. 3R8]BBF72152.1 hypothetical protein SBA_ch2_6850 [Sphingomonas bisphenolicum]